MSDESTEWDAPSFIVIRAPTTGNPANPPLARHCLNPFSHDGMIFGRNCSAGDLIDELEIPVGKRLQEPGDTAELAGSARLFLMGVVEFRPAGGRFAIGDLWHARFDLGVVLAPSSARHRRPGEALPSRRLWSRRFPHRGKP